MTRRAAGGPVRSLGAGLALSAALALAACEKQPDIPEPLPGNGPKTAPPSDPEPGTPPAPDLPETPVPAPRTGTPDAPVAPAGTTPKPKPGDKKPDPPAARGGKVVLPPAAPLTEDAARKSLLDAAETSHDAEVIRAALLGIAETSGLDAARAACTKLLAPGAAAGGVEDPDSAATAIEALLLAGDPGAAQKAVALARAGIDKGEVFASYATMLAAVGGPSAADARKLLVELTEDPDVAGAAARALAPLREPSAAARFHALATDAENVETETRAAAAAGLLALGDPRAEGVLAALVRGTELEGDAALDSYDVIDGLAVPGISESLPWIRKIVDPAIASDAATDIELRSLAGAYADVRGAGKGTKDDLETLGRLLGKAHGMADDELKAAMWVLGDDTKAEATANALAICVRDISSGVVDEASGVQLLEWIAARRAAATAPFRPVVDAAAAAEPPKGTKREDAVERVRRLRVAAARAFLASTSR